MERGEQEPGLVPDRGQEQGQGKDKDKDQDESIYDSLSQADGGFHTASRARGEERSVGEEAWSVEGEDLAREWGLMAQDLGEKHSVTGLKKKRFYQLLGFPSVLIPGVMAIVTPQLPTDEESTAWINMSFFAVSSALAASVSFFGFQRLHQQHTDFSARYANVASDVKYELVKARRYRVSQDEFLVKTQMKMDHLIATAPDL